MGAAAPSAFAGTATLDGFTAANNETNSLTVTQTTAGATTALTYSDTNNETDTNPGPPAGCVKNGNGAGNTVTCTFTNGSGGGQISLRLGDLNDETTFVGVTNFSVFQDGGAGSDTLRGPQSSTSSSGGDGDDVLFPASGTTNQNFDEGFSFLSGDAGNDILNASTTTGQFVFMDGGTGADRLLGGPGRERVSYRSRTAALTVTLDDQANDGEAGEGDNLVGSIDAVDGGAGDDAITGREGDESFDGGSGNDTLNGGAGDDNLSGDNGNDTLNGGTGDDNLDGGLGADVYRGGDGIDTVNLFPFNQTAPFGPLDVSVTLDNVANDGAAGEGDNVASDVEDVNSGGGNDTLIGNAGFNILNGDSGNDTIDAGPGNDLLFGNTGDDTLRARDGFADRVDCGPGTDTAVVDTLDIVGGNCEKIDRVDVGNANNDQAPKVAFTAPAANATIPANTPTVLSATATDDVAVKQVVFMVGERVVCTATVAPYTCSYRPRGEDVGRNTLLAVASDATGQTAFATRTVNVPRFTPTKLSITAKPKSDTRSPYRFTTAGKLTLPASVSAAQGCKGVVSIQVKAGTKTISNRKVKLSSACTYRSRVSFTLPRRLNPRTLRIRATFAGNLVLLTKASPRVTVRVGK